MALPEAYRLTVHLFYYEDYSVQEIARVLGLPQTTVRTRLFRGRELLKKALKEESP
jgi:RNA polymerase sigma-70 factor (ECF subfamily)